MFTGAIIGSKYIKNRHMSMILCPQKVKNQGQMSVFRLGKFKIVLLQKYLGAMIILPARTGATRLQLQFQQYFYTMSDKITQHHGIDPKLR